MIADPHELTGEWVKDCIRQRQALAKEARDVDSRLKKIFDVLELTGKMLLIWLT